MMMNRVIMPNTSIAALSHPANLNGFLIIVTMELIYRGQRPGL